MGNLELSKRFTEAKRLWGQVSGEPRLVPDQSKERIISPISPPWVRYGYDLLKVLVSEFIELVKEGEN